MPTQTASWHICVQIRDDFLSAMFQPDEHFMKQPTWFEVPVPMLPLHGAGCNSINCALVTHPQVPPFPVHKDMWASVADISITWFDVTARLVVARCKLLA